MAWIAVHNEVQGTKLRNLAKAVGCSRHEALGILVTLWQWGMTNADENGIIENADEYDIADAITIGLSPNLNPNNVVEALIRVGWIDYDEYAYYLHDWDEWQAPWYQYKQKVKKDTERKREYRKRLREEAGQSAGQSQGQSAGQSRLQKQDSPQAKEGTVPQPKEVPPHPDFPGLSSDLTDEELEQGTRMEQEVIPGIEAVLRAAGMFEFTAMDDHSLRELLMTYDPDEIVNAVKIAHEKKKVNWSYIRGILRRGGGKSGNGQNGAGSGAGSHFSAQTGQGNGGMGTQASRYNLESTRL